MPYKDKEKAKAAARASYLRHRESAIARARARHDRMKGDPHYRAVLNRLKEKYRREAGAIPLAELQAMWALKREQKSERDAQANAIRAWREWLKIAPLSWREAYWPNTSKPWRDPQLTEAGAYAVRVRHDPAFREAEYQRHLEKKRRHRRWIAERTVDVTSDDVKALRMLTTHCYICGVDLDIAVRTVDHITPLSKGGLHSRANLAGCCLSCNSAKQDAEVERGS